MKVAIMQPYFFPYIGYWQLINAVDVFVIYDDVKYINRGWINRNKIIINGTPNWLTLQLVGASQNKFINEIAIGDNKDKLIKTIDICYKKAIYFSHRFPMISEIILNKENNLSKYLENSIHTLCALMNINAKIILSSDLLKNNELKAQEKIVDICLTLNAKEYINPIGGMELYNNNYFHNNGIDLFFLKSNNIHYFQFDENYFPWLSLIDVLMFNPIEKIKEYLNDYELIKSFTR